MSSFDTLYHGQLRAILRKRVQDGVLLRLIGKWRHAGVLEDGGITYPDSGTPQGGVISPRNWLSRRGGRSSMSWSQFHRLEERYLLPAAIAVHSSYRRAANP